MTGKNLIEKAPYHLLTFIQCYIQYKICFCVIDQQTVLGPFFQNCQTEIKFWGITVFELSVKLNLNKTKKHRETRFILGLELVPTLCQFFQ